jgi:hypothetical protein
VEPKCSLPCTREASPVGGLVQHYSRTSSLCTLNSFSTFAEPTGWKTAHWLRLHVYATSLQFFRPPLWSSGQSSWLQNGDVLCLLWGTNWIYICYVEESRPSLWSNCQSCWLHIQRSGFDSRLYQIFWEVVGLERGPFILVSTTEELPEKKSSGFGLENLDYDRRASVALTKRHSSIRKSWH